MFHAWLNKRGMCGASGADATACASWRKTCALAAGARTTCISPTCSEDARSAAQGLANVIDARALVTRVFTRGQTAVLDDFAVVSRAALSTLRAVDLVWRAWARTVDLG